MQRIEKEQKDVNAPGLSRDRSKIEIRGNRIVDEHSGPWQKVLDLNLIESGNH